MGRWHNWRTRTGTSGTGGGVLGNLDAFGKLTGLLMSVLFFIFAVWFLMSGKLKGADQNTLNGFYALMIVLGGPIPYFFASSGELVKLRTPVGVICLTGGYAVVVAALYFVIAVIPSQHVWRLVKVVPPADDATARQVVLVDYSPPGSMFRVESAEGSRVFPFVLYFGPEDTSIRATFEVKDAYGPRPCEPATLLRAGEPFPAEPFELRPAAEEEPP